jgi:hypothetical protein
MPERPVACPRADCPSHSGKPFTYQCRGSFSRLCDRRTVQRFQCMTCSRGFSEQTLRVDWRLKRPELLALFFIDRISKVTHRQSARNHACSRSTEERHFRRLSGHCKAFHAARLAEIKARGGLGRTFLLDELETYEHHRTEKPVTVPVLIERESGFVIDTRVGMLPARGKRGKARAPAVDGAEPRKSESREMVHASFEVLLETAPREGQIRVLTDKKESYALSLKKIFGARCEHLRTISTRRRDVTNPLWPINHTLARLRDGISRLVRKTWAASKLRRWLAGHLDIWVCYRNYVRWRTNKTAGVTPAMALGAQKQLWEVGQLLGSRVFPWG